MVRHKRRWLFVRFPFRSQDDGDDDDFPSRKELSRRLREQLEICFGVASHQHDVQVRLCVPSCNLAVIRIPRASYRHVRATITLLAEPLDVFRVHGSARTAKIAALRELETVYRKRIKDCASQKKTHQLCLDFRTLHTAIQNLE